MKKLGVFLVAVFIGASAVPLISLAGGAFYVDSVTGFVGIGNTTPASNLDVSGSMYSRLVTDSDSSSVTTDWNAGNVHAVDLNTSNTTFTFTNGQAGGEYKLILKQDATGGRTVTWPGSVKWLNGSAPTLASTASSTNLVSFIYDGSRYLGSYVPRTVESIAYDNASSTPGTGTSPSSFTFGVGTSGDNKILLGGYAEGLNNFSSASYSGNAMTASSVGTGGFVLQSMYLLSPSTGSHTFTASNGGGGSYGLTGITYTGVEQTAPDQVVTNTSTGTSITDTINETRSNCWMVMFVVGQNGTPTAGTNATARSIGSSGNGTISVFDSNGPIPTGGYSMTVNGLSNQGISSVAFAICPVS